MNGNHSRRRAEKNIGSHAAAGLLLAAACLASLSIAGGAGAAATRSVVSSSASSRADSLYSCNHPRLLFTTQEILALRIKVRDGGPDDAAYAAIREIVTSLYPTQTDEELFLDPFAAMNIAQNCGLAGYLETPIDAEALAFGRHVTLSLVDSSQPDAVDVFYSSLRLRSLCFGYDMFFADAPESLRAAVRSEILAYVDTTMSVFRYQWWLYSPYVSNYNAVIGSALGLAALCLEKEMPHEWTQATLARADEYVRAWAEAHLDPDGSYDEGPLYAGWSLRNLVYYFWARSRLYDHYDLSTLAGLPDLEKWLAYSLLPIGHASVNNVNDSSYLGHGLSLFHTYLDWAETVYGSGVSAWIWDRIAGPEYGYDGGVLADKPATVLWNRGLSLVNPGERFSRRMFWRGQGLYYFRTGWPEGDASNDVVFSFRSGKFMGGHAQEDQNNFTLWGYGTGLATDNGPGSVARQTEGHNLVLIDGGGQHNAGGSIGTDGAMREHVLGTFADYLLGDATAAYTTYSEFNRAGCPFPGNDWSWGYDGGNPVESAERRIAAIHEPGSPPYFVIQDEIRKDGLPRLYSWRLHTDERNAIDLAGNPIGVHGGSGLMNLFVMAPAFDSLAVSQAPFDNGNDDPNTTVISLSYEGRELSLCALLIPDTDPPRHAVVKHVQFPWGSAAVLAWAQGATDVVIFNRSGQEVTCSVAASLAREQASPASTFVEPIVTDARLAILRIRGSAVAGLLANDASRFDYGGRPYARVYDGRLNLIFSADTVDVDRPDADFSFYLPRGGKVRYETSVLPILIDGGYAVPARSDAPAPPVPPLLRAFPNPFNATVTIEFTVRGDCRPTIAVYDVRGSLIRRLVSETVLPAGVHTVAWDGRNGRGHRVPSGVYICRMTAPDFTGESKIVLVR